MFLLRPRRFSPLLLAAVLQLVCIAPLRAQDGDAPARDAIRAGWQAWHAGLCYPLTGTDRHRADEFATRAVGVPWGEFCRLAPVPADLVEDLSRYAVRIRTLRRVVRLAMGTAEREKLLDAFDIAALCDLMPGLRRELGTDDGVFATPAEAATFARALEQAWPQTWGNWLGRLTAERVADVLLARTAEELFPCDTLTRDGPRGEQRALQLAGTDTWAAFIQQAGRLPEWRRVQEQVAKSAEQADALRRLVCSAATWREAHAGAWGAVPVPSQFASADELQRFAALFADRFPEVWANWMEQLAPEVTWETILHYHAGRLAGLAGENDDAGRALAEQFAGVPWSELPKRSPSFATMAGDGVAWGRRASALRDLLTTPATAALVRDGKMADALAQPGASNAGTVLGSAMRATAFAEQFRGRFPGIWQRWIDGIDAAEIRHVLRARAAWQFVACESVPGEVDAARADGVVLELTSMVAREWMRLAAAHAAYAAISAEADAFGMRVGVLRRLYCDPDTFRAARAGNFAGIDADLLRDAPADLRSAAGLGEFAATVQREFPALVDGWRRGLSSAIADEWFRQAALGRCASPTGEDDSRGRQRAASFYGAGGDVFRDALEARPDAEAIARRGDRFLRALRTLRALVMEPQTFGTARRGDFARIWDDPALRAVATRDGAFESPADASDFSRMIATRYPDVWQGWLEHLTPEIARAICRTWVAGLLHRSDDQDDPAFATAFVLEQIGLDWAALNADNFRIESDDVAATRAFLATHTRRVRVLRELMCNPDTREYAQRMDLRGALTIRAGLAANARFDGFRQLGDATPAAALFAAEFPSIWNGWRVRVALTEARAREILEVWHAGRNAVPDITKLSDPQAERMVQAAAGTPWREFLGQLRAKEWGARVDGEVTRDFGRRIAALRLLVLSPGLRALFREGRIADVRDSAMRSGEATVRAAISAFDNADHLHSFVLRVQSGWPALWASWNRASDSTMERARLAWLAFHVAGWRSEDRFDEAAARAAMSVVTRQAAEQALQDPAIAGLRGSSHELSRRVRLLRQLLTDPATRDLTRSLDFVTLARGNQLVLDGRKVFASPEEAAAFARQLREDFPAVWSEWSGLRR